MGGITAGALWLWAMWRKRYAEDPVSGLFFARRLKLGTNLVIVGMQAAGYLAELLAGSRTGTPATSSTTANVDPALAAKYNSRTADSVGA